eukprot:TRINITY_DN12958_c0_g1_i2.p1 TRINITY_DN12958_c0_g1~~TRINITY_DN12958_c0_g1_i2.p1  ORF type:complete len:193 (-),score=24.34 TRINITY_DN12958_c0_g1_i2:333-911(-)
MGLVKTLELFYCFTILSAALLVGCAYALFLESASTQQNVLGSVKLDDDDSMYGKMAALTSYSIVNATVSCSLFVSRALRTESPHVSENAQVDLPTLKDVTLHTFVVDDLEATVDHASDAGESCCICLSPLLSGEVVNELTCHHRYHKSCLEGWDEVQRMQGRSMRCPLRCAMRTFSETEGGRVHEQRSFSTE